MGRSIPSFRQLIEIERLNWSEFKKGLLTKNEKVAFDIIFENARLYTQYLSNANRPIPIEPIMMGALFHNYKTLLKLNSERKLNEDSILKKVAVMEREQPTCKILFDKTSERWRGLLYAIHRDEREQILRMFADCCDSLGDGAAKVVMDKNSFLSLHLFLCIIKQNQDLILRIKNSSKKENIKSSGTLFDFIN
ncbi:MAG TPA: hypothetical protein VJU13_13015 [Candidatus Nitrosocosmicus sp.]|jgi:hypothetical protein|nr:hypothetical protein [Candidatus Nitrosocosmicus sp.]